MKHWLSRLSAWLEAKRYASHWEHGTCTCQFRDGPNTSPARRNRHTGEVQFVLWPKGKVIGGHICTEDFWIGYDPSWWAGFKPNSP